MLVWLLLSSRDFSRAVTGPRVCCSVWSRTESETAKALGSRTEGILVDIFTSFAGGDLEPFIPKCISGSSHLLACLIDFRTEQIKCLGSDLKYDKLTSVAAIMLVSQVQSKQGYGRKAQKSAVWFRQVENA